MNIGRVEGSVVCSVKTPTLTGVKLLVVRLLALQKLPPCDLCIAGIIDPETLVQEG